jgi:ParB family transcriptional regulator, chromosome partitioning protein
MAFQGDSIYWVEVEKIVPNPFQPRREFDEAKLKELAESIRMYGILQPLTVTKKEVEQEDGAFYSEYELIAGERRLRASKLAGLSQVPVIIRSGQQTEQEKLELAIIENLQREDLNAVDRALAFRQLADVFDLSHAQVAKKVGRSREYVSNSIRLLGLPDYMLSSLRTAEISEGHARTLLMLKDRPEEQDVVFREILLKKLSVREVERITRKIAADKVRKKNWVNTDAVLIEIEREFTDTLGTRVQISKTDFGGKLTIDYFSDEDLQKLLAIVKSQGKITNFHLAGTEEVADDSLEKLTAATVLEPVVEELTPTSLAEEAIESEQAVSEVIEEVVVEGAQYAGAQTEEVVAPPQVEEKKEEEKEEDDLYSMRNFNL